MAEKKFTDKLDRMNYELGLIKANNFQQSGVIAFNHEVFLKAINNIYSEEVYIKCLKR